MLSQNHTKETSRPADPHAPIADRAHVVVAVAVKKSKANANDTKTTQKQKQTMQRDDNDNNPNTSSTFACLPAYLPLPSAHPSWKKKKTEKRGKGKERK
jgi:hypothetical protein